MKATQNMLPVVILLAGVALSPTVAGDTTFRQYVELMFQFDAVFETLCLERTNDSREARRMVAANQELQDCVNLHHDPQNFTNALDTLTVGNRNEFINYNCGQFEEIKRCYGPFMDQLEKCFTPRDVSMAKALIMLEEEFAFICDDGGVNVLIEASSNYSYCAGNLKELMQNCSMMEWAELREKTIATMTDRDCSIFEKLAVCFQNNIIKCGAPLFAKLFNIRYRAIVKQTVCGKSSGD